MGNVLVKRNMNEIERVSSESGNQFIDIVQADDGSYMLHQFVRKFDPEEEQYYVIRISPDPAGKFGDLTVAFSEAKKIMALI
ncbi:MAG: hypothetical protein AAGB12_15425 [Pseudomonadota bacterium]